MAASLPFWDPGAFGGTPPQNPDISQPVRTSIPEPPAGAFDPSISSWETIYFAGVRAPGICRVDGGRRRLVDPRMIPGSSGQLPVVLAFMPAEFTVTLVMWTSKQFDAFKTLADTLYPKPVPSQLNSGDPSTFLKAVDVSHPAFLSLGVKSIYVVDIRAPRPGTIPQSMEAVIDCIEFFPPMLEGAKVVNASVAETSPGSNSFPQPAPNSRTPPKGPDQTNVNP